MKNVVLLLWDGLACLGLGELVKSVLPQAETRTFRRATEAVESMEKVAADLVILDVHTEDLDGLDHVPDVVERGLASRIILTTPRYDPRTMALWRRFGCLLGYLDTNTILRGDVHHALRCAGIRKRFVCASLEEKLSSSSCDGSHDLLSEKEGLVLSVLGEGVDDGEAGRRLRICPATVRSHRQRIMNKLGLHHKGELVSYALRNVYTRYTSCGVLHPGFEKKLADGAANGSGAAVSADERGAA